MNWFSVILVSIVALLHLYFLILEMFLWTRPIGRKIFKNSEESAMATSVLAANQGLYNGFLTAGLVWGLAHPDPAIGQQIQIFFLICVMVAGIYGAYSVSRRILYVQFAPALLAAATVLFS